MEDGIFKKKKKEEEKGKQEGNGKGRREGSAADLQLILERALPF